MSCNQNTRSIPTCLLILLAILAATGVAKPPAVQVVSVRKVYDDGKHNAFTDICRFGGRYYLTFRNCPDGHGVFATSRILVLSSADAEKWEQVFSFDVPRRDTRDPHFLIFNGKLFVYTGCWLVPPAGEEREMNDMLGYAAWSADGRKWEGPRLLEGTYGHYIWRAAAHDGTAYLCARRKQEFLPSATRAQRDPLVQSAMLKSDDGLIWRYAGMFQEDYGNETAFLFDDDGSILAVARGSGGQPAQVCRAEPPYEKFSRTKLDRQIGGPLVARWGEDYLVGGRKTVGSAPKTALYWLVGDKLHEIAELPSGGDNSYPGFVRLDDRRALISYYSSHEGSRNQANIYLAELAKEP